MISLLTVKSPLVALYTMAVSICIQEQLNQFSAPAFQIDAAIVGPVALVCGSLAGVIVGGFQLLRSVAAEKKRL